MSTQALIAEQSPRVIDLRHRLHQIPELMYEERETAAAIRRELDQLGLAHTDGVAGAPTATIAMVGDTRKPCLALRADIDALPIEEKTGLPYASRHTGRMHACGHDGHSAILMGAAAALKAIENDLPVCVKFLWQPAEEGGAGADRLVRAGVLDGRLGPKVSAIFGLHGWPGLPVGTIATKPGALLAATDNFHITFTGRGCHGAFPHLGIDPIVPAAGQSLLAALLWSPLHVLRERDRVRVVFDWPMTFELPKNPHPGPLPEYRARGKSQKRLPWGRAIHGGSRRGAWCARE
jgi:amidohydrolase